MQVISARNVNEALLLGLHAVNEYGLLRDSRVGPVKVFKTPVTTIYEKPKERVLFYPERDANPFFHFMEGLWMIAGRNDVKWISRFNASIANYSDDSATFHGAYGHRWRNHFGLDQLSVAAQCLRENPDDRRVSLQMWDCDVDLGRDGKDFPCNQMINLRIMDGQLDMTVFNRSNDMIWGAYGANAVHFSMLQEVMAAWIGVEVGHYWQVSTNFHAYVNTLEKHSALLDLSPGFDEYNLGEVSTYNMVDEDINTWMQDLEIFMTEGMVMNFQTRFFKKVAVPMFLAWDAYKKGHYQRAVDILIDDCAASDWQKAGVEWILRRVK